MMKEYFFDTSDAERVDLEKQEKYYILMIYDVVDNKKRTKLAKLMKSYGFRVQKSAFEAKISNKKYKKLMAEIQPFISQEDSIRIYKIRGEGAVTIYGISEDFDDDFIII